MLSPDWQKLACNLLSVGADALPRGGRLVLTDRPLSLEAVGEPPLCPLKRVQALMLATPIADLTRSNRAALFHRAARQSARALFDRDRGARTGPARGGRSPVGTRLGPSGR